MKSLPLRLAGFTLRLVGLEAWARGVYHRRTRPPPPEWLGKSETSKCRERLAPYCQGFGLDLGFGGDPITPHAIRVDLPTPYAQTGAASVQLGGDASRLGWFRDNSLDFLFSSHLLEDFAETDSVLREWLRVLKPGGRLIIFCPDEQRYRRHCAASGQPYNTHHVHADFSLEFVRRSLERVGGVRLIHQNPDVDVYSWEVVAEKTEPEAPLHA